MIGGVDFVGMPTRDLPQAAAFYGETLALRRSVYIEERHYAEFETGNLTLSVYNAEQMGLEHHVNRNPYALHVDDVAEGHLLAQEKGRIGENYILGGHNVMLKEMLAEIARLTGRKPPRISLPRAPLHPLAYIFELAARITGKEPMLNSDALKMAKYKMFFSSAKAKRELGYTVQPWRLAVADAVNWFNASGYIR